MRLYFAYGSNMVPAQMAKRCPGAQLIGSGALPGHRFAIIRGGHGTVLRDSSGTVYGLLWRLARGNAQALDRYEEVAGGLYRRQRCGIVIAGRVRLVHLYVAARTASGRPRRSYIAAIAAAARLAGLPPDYRRKLEALLPR